MLQKLLFQRSTAPNEREQSKCYMNAYALVLYSGHILTSSTLSDQIDISQLLAEAKEHTHTFHFMKKNTSKKSEYSTYCSNYWFFLFGRIILSRGWKYEMKNWWITQVPRTQGCFRRRLLVKGEMSSWGNGKLPGMGRVTQDGASAGEGKGWAGPGGTACVSPCVPCPGTMTQAQLSIPLLPHPPERAWASSSTTAPLLQGRSPTQLSPRRGAERQEKEKVEKKRKGAIKIIFASLPVVMQSLIFTNEGKQPQHMSKYLNLPPCFPCALKK